MPKAERPVNLGRSALIHLCLAMHVEEQRMESGEGLPVPLGVDTTRMT
mgnify:FL=1